MVRYFLLLNQLRAGDILLVTVMAVGLGCNNMKRCFFDKWCWSAGTESCTICNNLFLGSTCIR